MDFRALGTSGGKDLFLTTGSCTHVSELSLFVGLGGEVNESMEMVKRLLFIG